MRLSLSQSRSIGTLDLASRSQWASRLLRDCEAATVSQTLSNAHVVLHHYHHITGPTPKLLDMIEDISSQIISITVKQETEDAKSFLIELESGQKYNRTTLKWLQRYIDHDPKSFCCDLHAKLQSLCLSIILCCILGQ